MTENTPSTNQISYGWAAFRGETSGVSSDAAYAEFNRWIAVHDQGIRDAVGSAEMTAREHMDAAWEAAHPVPEGRTIHAGTPYLLSRYDGGMNYEAVGLSERASEQPFIRTLTPLPPLIPDGCMEVEASSDGDPVRSVWIRDAQDDDVWVTVTTLGYVMRAYTRDLIDPSPVSEEER